MGGQNASGLPTPRPFAGLRGLDSARVGAAAGSVGYPPSRLDMDSSAPGVKARRPEPRQPCARLSPTRAEPRQVGNRLNIVVDPDEDSSYYQERPGTAYSPPLPGAYGWRPATADRGQGGAAPRGSVGSLRRPQLPRESPVR